VVLGMLGGFLTPILLSTGQDAPLGLFSYIALLDVVIIAVALHCRWNYLLPLAALGTVVMELGWLAHYFAAGSYDVGWRTLVPFSVLSGFYALWLWVVARAMRLNPRDAWASGAALSLGAIAFLTAFYFSRFAGVDGRPWLLFGFVFVLDLLTLGVARRDAKVQWAYTVSGGVVFLFLSIWMGSRSTEELLAAALTYTLVFALAHTVLPIWLGRRDGRATLPPDATLFPPVALVVLLIPIFRVVALT